MPNAIAIAFSTFGLIILISVFFVNSTIQSNPVPVENDLTITTGPGFRNLYFFLVLLMTLNKFLISPSIGPGGYGNWWEALFNVLMTGALVWYIIYFLPYQSMTSNRIRGGIFTSLFWLASCSFMYINIPQTNPNLENFALDYIVIAGMLPFYLVGDFLVSIRISHMTAIALELVETNILKKKIAAEKKEKEGSETKAIEKKVLRAADKKKEDEKKDGPKDLRSKMLRAAKGMGAKVNTMADVVNKTLDPNNKSVLAAAAAANAVEANKTQVGETEEEKLARNPRLHLPGILYHFQATSNTIDMVGRMLWHHTDKKEFLETAKEFYQKAELAFPDRKYIKVLRVTFLTATATDPSAHLSKLDAISKLEPSLATRYFIFRRKSEVKIIASRVVSEDKTAVELVNYVEFQRFFADTQAYNNIAIQSIREFWMLFLQKSISFSAFTKATQFMQSECNKTLLIYKSMLLRYPRYSALLNSYAYFLELILHNAEEAAKYHRRADEQKLREAEEAKNNDGTGSIDTQCVIAITEDGQIEQVNKTLLTVFGYSRKEVMGRNIRMLVPSPWKEKHDIFLQRYRHTGVAKVIARPQTLFGQHKSGVSFQMRLTIQERRKENGERQFIGMIAPIQIDSVNGVIIINEMGYIRLVTQRTLDLFGGYEASDLLTRNVNMLMIDSMAVAHDNHLKRYRETGEARVIGTNGRNVPGRRKDNSVFPASLTVEEIYLEGERSFIANIQDTSNTVGTIFMDGFGIIQNSDLGLQQLLGYRKEDIVGKNIKGIMPPPYSEYHDMYLERYRRTKVSNILRSTEGRILPAIHADGSSVSIRAIISRADTGDGTSGMLFKGIIKRGDLSSMSGKDFRKGYFENFELSLNKAGVIVRIKRQILNMLGHASDRPLSDFIGQPIEVLIPALPDRPGQAKTNWMLRAMKDPEHNFYLLAVCKNFALLPISFCLQLSDDNETFRMRIRDLSDADALMTIDEVGNVLSYNDEAYILLGYDTDDVIGRNIKAIQPPDVAANHDSYLKKYKNTKDKAQGVPRSVTGMHRDGNPIPIEIQITDQKGSEGVKGIIGRLRHRTFDERVPRDLVLKYFTNTKLLGDLGVDGASASVIASAASVTSGASRLRFKGKKTSSNNSGSMNAANAKKSQQLTNKMSEGKLTAFDEDANDYQMTSQSDLGSESSNGTSKTSASTRNRIFDEKFKNIHSSEKEDPSLSRLGFVLNILLSLYLIIFVVGLILINVIPSPEPYYELMDLVAQFNVKLNEVIFASRFLALAKNSSLNAAPCAFSNETAIGKPVCDWVAAANKYPKKTVPALEDFLRNSAEGFVDAVNLFGEKYRKIRRPGDVLDTYLQGTFITSQYVNGTPSSNTSFTMHTLWNVAGVLSDSANTLESNVDLSEKSARAWNFILGNRIYLNQVVKDLVYLVPEVVKSSLEKTVIYHLVLAIISIVLGALGLFFAIVPQFRKVQQDREKILRLIVLLPKSVVYDLVYKVYAAVDVEAEESQDDAAEIDLKSEQENKVDSNEEDDDEVDEGAALDAQDITVIPDRSNKIYTYFAIGLFSISIPLVAHVAWRYAFDVELFKTVTLVTDITVLYTSAVSISWRPMGLYFNCYDEQFCDNFPKNKEVFIKNLDAMKAYYDEAMMLSSAVPTVNGIFQKVITEPYESPQNKLNRIAQREDPFLSPGYADKTTLGMSTMIANILDSGRKLAERFKTDSDKVNDDFWFLWEVLNNEGETGMYTLFEASVDKFKVDLNTGNLAANAAYAVGLVYSILVFWFGFGAIRSHIRRETKASRNALYMVPIQVVRVTKPIIEYVEQLHLALSKS